MEHEIFVEWLEKIKDPIGKAGITARLTRARNSNFSDHKLLPDTSGIYEMRIFKGNGYRIYYTQQGVTIYLLLTGGSKDQQQTEIDKAKKLWEKYKRKIKMREFDPVNYLTDEATIHAYLNELLNEGTPQEFI